MKLSTPKKIFIVDDDEMLTMALTDYLEEQGHSDITVFHTGEEASAGLKENPDVIVLDYFLNSVNKDAANGLEVLQAFRKALPNAQYIMLSSQESYGTAAKTIQEGAESYVIKDESAFEKIGKIIGE